MRYIRRVPAFAAPDLLATLAASAAVLTLCIAATGRLRSDSMVDQSLGNLAALGLAHVLYAADWNGRQYTNAVDDLSSYGSDANSAVSNYRDIVGFHPGIPFGYSEQGLPVGYWFGGYQGRLVAPITFGVSPLGTFRYQNTMPFHEYVDGRFYGPSFYAPADEAVMASVAELLTLPASYPFLFDPMPRWSSYCSSPAAMYHPDVMRAEADGGWQDPWGLDHGLASPALAAAAYPDLKTHTIEHNWVQDPPATCNPAFDDGWYDGCEPYYFNHGVDSSPATLFYDGHVRLLPNAEGVAADQLVLAGTGGVDGLWHRGTPFGTDGYFIDLGYDLTPLSHHVLTTGGILGRDTVDGATPTTLAADTPGPPIRFEAARHRRLMSVTPWMSSIEDLFVTP